MNQTDHPGPELEKRPGHDTRIYVASLSDYNAGILHGEWLDPDRDPDVLLRATGEMLKRSPTARQGGQPAEEFAIHDYEGFGPLQLSESEDLGVVSRLARGIGDFGQPFAHWAAMHGKLDEREIGTFEDAYLGEWSSVKDYADHILDDLGYTEQIIDLVPQHLRPYITIDSSAFGRDLILGGDIHASETADGTVHLFDNRE